MSAGAPPPRILLTPGEPAGIGPDLVVLAAQQRQTMELIAVADPELLLQRAMALGLPLRLQEWDPAGPAESRPQSIEPSGLAVLPVPLRAPTHCGTLDPRNAPYVLETLQRATWACMSGAAAALVTGPVHKGVINDAGIPFTGHTEYLAQLTGTPRVVMMLATAGLRVALATTHLPLAAVSAAITRDSLREVLQILEHDLRTRFGLDRPRILVCGLNPHAGEGGHLGREEIDTIGPVIAELQAAGMALQGPLPADTLFTPPQLATADAVLAMYHDQGLPVLKHLGFGRAVNITLGLPIVRTSVDHGTALDLASTGKIDTGSLAVALATATLMAQAGSGV